MHIITPKMYILAPKMEKVYLLKRYSPSDGFCTFFLRVCSNAQSYSVYIGSGIIIIQQIIHFLFCVLGLARPTGHARNARKQRTSRRGNHWTSGTETHTVMSSAHSSVAISNQNAFIFT